MTKFVAFAFIAAASAAPAFAAPAPAPNEKSFTRDGETYYMTTTDMGRYTRISGHDGHGRTFDLHQSGIHVTGYYDEHRVEFSTWQVARPAEVATR